MSTCKRKQSSSLSAESPGVKCLWGISFVFIGALKGIERATAESIVTSLGGRVTNKASGKTNYVVMGAGARDTKTYQEAIKFHAKQLNEQQFLTLLRDERLIVDLMERKVDRWSAERAALAVNNGELDEAMQWLDQQGYFETGKLSTKKGKASPSSEEDATSESSPFMRAVTSEERAWTDEDMDRLLQQPPETAKLSTKKGRSSKLSSSSVDATIKSESSPFMRAARPSSAAESEKKVKEEEECSPTVYNAEQLAFIQRPLQDTVLIGIPGGGKTRSILARIEWLMQQQLIQRYLVVTFSRQACEDFCTKGKKMGVQHISDTSVRTIHSVAGSILSRAFNKSASKQSDRKNSSIDTVVHRARLYLQTAPSAVVQSFFPGVGAVFVDEAQDISHSQYEFVKALSQMLGAPLTMVGDPNQSIYSFQGGSPRFIMNHVSSADDIIQLRTNYRSKPEIVALANKAAPIPLAEPMLASDAGAGQRPELIGGVNIKALEAELVASVTSAHRLGQSVAIIGPVKSCRPDSYGSVLNIGLQWAMNVLHTHSIPCKAYYVEGSSEQERRAKSTTTASSHDVVSVLTIHGAKGLEFDHVCLLNFHWNTMTLPPSSPEQEQEWNMLWYVGLTRAKRSLHILHLNKKLIWKGFWQWNELVSVSGAPPMPIALDKYKLKQSEPKVAFGWTDVFNLSNFTVEKRYDLEELWRPQFIKTGKMEDLSDLPDEDTLCPLYGIWAENQFACIFSPQEMPPIWKQIQKMNSCLLYLEPQLGPALTQLLSSMGKKEDRASIIRWSELQDHWSSLQRNAHVRRLLECIEERHRECGQSEFFLHIATNLRWWDTDVIDTYLKQFADTSAHDERRSHIAQLWRLCLISYQYNVEAAYRMNVNYDEHVTQLVPYYDRLCVIAERMHQHVQNSVVFQKPCKWPHLPIQGEADLVDQTSRLVVEFKFSREIQMSHAIQVLGYAEMLGGRDVGRWTTEVWSLRTGERAYVEADTDAETRWKVYALFSDVIDKPLQQTCFVYDLETTGVNVTTCEIIDIHVQDFQTGIVPVSSLVQPMRLPLPVEITALTGISTDDVADQPTVTSIARRLEDALSRCHHPKLIAHNGNTFDHRIIERVMPRLRFEKLDSLSFVSDLLCDRKLPNKKLMTVYQELGGSCPGQSHRAKADVDMLIYILDQFNLSELQDPVTP